LRENQEFLIFAGRRAIFEKIFPSMTQVNSSSPPAGFWIRVLAAFIDGMIFLPTVVLLFVDFLEWKSFLVVVLISLPSFIYKPFMESLKGATLGKMACGLRVIDENGGNLPLGKAYLRSLPNLAAMIVGMLGYALLFADPAFMAATTIIDFLKLNGSNELGGATFIIEFFILIDCLVVAFNPGKRAIHDYLAGSFCVRAGSAPEWRPPEGDDAFYCSNCDAEIPRDALICPNCGTRFE
jgi:uncharacterized RDD family membrane protein YckC